MICFNFSCFSYLEPLTLQFPIADLFFSSFDLLSLTVLITTEFCYTFDPKFKKKNVCESGLTLFVITQGTGFI